MHSVASFTFKTGIGHRDRLANNNFFEFRVCGIITELEGYFLLVMSVLIVHICNEFCVKSIDLRMIYF